MPRSYLLNGTSSYNEKVDHFVAADRSIYKNRRSAVILTTILATLASTLVYFLYFTNKISHDGANLDNDK